MNSQGLNINTISEGVRPLLEAALSKSFNDFIGAQVEIFEEASEEFLDENQRLRLPAGIFSQMGFGNSMAEGALILCAQPDTFYKVAPSFLPEGDIRLAVDVLGEMSNLVGGLLLNEGLFKDPYDSFALAPPIKFENKGGVKYFENTQGINIILKLKVNETSVLCGLLLRERKPFYFQYPTEDCKPLTD